MRWLAGFVAIASLLWLAAPAGASGQERRVSLSVDGGDPATTIRVEINPSSGIGSPLEIVLRSSGKQTVDLPGEGPWTLRAAAQGFWVPPAAIPSPPPADFAIKLWPAAEVSFELGAPEGLAAPRETVLRLTSSRRAKESGAQAPDGELTCSVGEAARSVCALPAGRWDLRLSWPGFVPHYFWQIEIPPGTRRTLGPMRLQEGSSISGRVDSSNGSADLGPIRIELNPHLQSDAGSAGVPEEMKKLMQATAPNAWGYFQFVGLPAGAYEFRAKQGQLESIPQRIDLGPRDIVELNQPLVLLPPARLLVRVFPPTDPARNHLWNLEVLRRRAGNLESLHKAKASPEGAWRSPSLPAGQYTIALRDTKGATYAWEEVTASHEEAVVDLLIDAVPVIGVLKVGGEPLAAKLWFGGRHGEVRIPTESNEEGRFDLILSRPGKWKVSVSGTERQVEVSRLVVDVPAPTGAQAVEVSIDLPRTLLQGTVVDGQRAPVTGADVLLFRMSAAPDSVRQRTDAKGRFKFEGQEPGSYFLQASDGTRASARLEVEIREDDRPNDLSLVLEEQRRIRGLVRSRAGAVAGAWVLAYPLTLDGGLATIALPEARTALDGSFDLEIPGRTQRLRIVATAPGFTLFISQEALESIGKGITIQLDSAVEGGRLLITRPHSAVDGGTKLPAVFVNGVPVDFPLLQIWAAAGSRPSPSTGTFEVGAMPAGHYAYCELEPEEIMAVVAGVAAPAPSACVRGDLLRGSELALALEGAEGGT